MEERNTVKFKKDEFTIREYIKEDLGKGKVSKVQIEYTPVGEKIIVSTNKPGLVIGRKGERIEELTNVLKKNFKLENPRIEIDEILEENFDAQIIADEIALALERAGPLKFKVISYRTLQKVMEAGALGVEIVVSGKLPGSRAKSWRFAQGYLKKTGDSAKVVDRAQARAQTKPGTVGIKVSILSPHAVLKDKIQIDDKVLADLKGELGIEVAPEEPVKEVKKKSPKKVVEKKEEKKELEVKKESKDEEVEEKKVEAPKESVPSGEGKTKDAGDNKS